jgi:2-keto-4-pentenoate hydratase
LRDLEISTHPVRAHLEQGSGMRYTKDGSGSNVLGDPRMVLTWPANHLSALGIILEKGQVMATGTCMPPLELQAADSVLADFGHLGDVRMTFSET